MAGDWIKMRDNLWDDPRVAALCDACDCTEAQIIGGLYWIWSTADQHTESGHMPGLTLRQIDRKTGIKGFGDAMCSIGWLEDCAGGVSIVNFDDHNGSSAKKRAMTAKRVAKHRDSNAVETQEQSKGNDDVTHDALQMDDVCVTGALAREREREIDIKAPPIVPPGYIPSGVDQPKPKRAKREAVTLDIYRAAGGKLIRGEDDPIWTYCETIGLPHDFVRLAGHEFLARFSGTKKLQADWPAHFRNAIRANWFRLWFQSGDGWELTTAGHQAKRMQREAS